MRNKFNIQLKRMSTQKKHKYKDVCEKWEYALRKIKKDNGKNN